MRVIPGALAEAVVVGEDVPGFAAVVGAEDAALLGFDDGPDAIGIGAGDGDADAAENGFGQAVAFEFLPGGAAIGGAIEAAAGAAAVEAPRSAAHLPERGVDDVGIGGIEGEIDAAGLGIFVENFLPGLAAILRAEDAALFVVGEGMAEGGDEGDVGIFGIDDQASDGVGVAEADEFPGGSGVDGFVDAVAADDVAAHAGFAGADVDDVGIGLGDGDGADGGRGVFRLVEDGPPVEAAVGGLPDAAGSRAHVVGVGLSDDAGDGDYAAAAERAD